VSKRVRAHPAVIGAFVLGAIGLAIAALLIFSASGTLFGRKFPVVMLFDDSVNGLAVGAPVAYRGIRLGQVTDIRSVVGSPRIEVTARLERGPFLTPEDPTGVDRMRRALEEAIQQGLRAQLALQSLLTGHLYVSLVLRPDVPASLTGLAKGALEIPTIPSIMAQFETGLQRVPLANVPKVLYDTLEGTARIVQGPALEKTLQAVGPLLADAQTLLQRLDKDIPPLIASVKGTSDQARASLIDITQQLDGVAKQLTTDVSRLTASLTETSDTARGTVKDVGTDLQQTLQQLTPQIAALSIKLQDVSETLKGTLETTGTTFRNVDGVVTGNSALGYQLQQALAELATALQAIRSLADYLERHPDSLIRGKPDQKSAR